MKPGEDDAVPAVDDAPSAEDAPEGDVPVDGGVIGEEGTTTDAPAGEDGAPSDVVGEEPVADAVPEATAEELTPAEAPVPVTTDTGFPMMPVGGGIALLLILAVVGKALLGGPATPQVPDTAPEPALPDTEPDLPEEHTAEVEPPADTLVARFARALGRSREAMQGRFDVLFGRDTIDESLFEELEEVLLKADVGLPTTEKLLAPLRELAEKDADLPQLRASLRANIERLLLEHDPSLTPAPDEGPWVLLVVGVNGSGKTTTIGKLAARFRAEGKQVLLAAGDTYRAAAADQLKIWAERAEVDIVAHDEGSDAGAVVYDALDAAKARGKDVVIVDTAGRLQTARPLMEQLGKIRRVIDKKVPGGPHETLLVLDGTMGQNGLSQAKLFNEATPLTGAVITKLDGTAKGGMVLTLSSELALPVKFIGIGEGIDDLKPFDAPAFAEALA